MEEVEFGVALKKNELRGGFYSEFNPDYRRGRSSNTTFERSCSRSMTIS